jgi:hypothetical protein
MSLQGLLQTAFQKKIPVFQALCLVHFKYIIKCIIQTDLDLCKRYYRAFLYILYTLSSLLTFYINMKHFSKLTNTDTLLLVEVHTIFRYLYF